MRARNILLYMYYILQGYLCTPIMKLPCMILDIIDFMKDMRLYMLPAHRKFVEAVEKQSNVKTLGMAFFMLVHIFG